MLLLRRTFGYFATLLFSLVSTVLSYDEVCEHGPYADYGRTFGENNHAFNFCEQRLAAGGVITGIDTWTAKTYIMAIQFTFSDGTKSAIWGGDIGNKDIKTGNHETVSWESTQLIEKLKMWDNPDLNAFGGFEITVGGKTTKRGRGKALTFLENGAERNVGGGLLVAAYGYAGRWVDSIQLKFIAGKVESAIVSDLKFKDSIEAYNSQKKGMEHMSLKKGTFPNPNEKGGEDISYSLEGYHSKVDEHTHTLGVSVFFGMTTTMSANVKVPLLGEAGWSLQLERSITINNENSDSHSEEDSVTWSVSGKTAPQRATYCSITAWNGVFDGDYDSTVTLKMSGGSTFSLKSWGHFKSSSWANAEASCHNVPINDVPSDVPRLDNTKGKKGFTPKRITAADKSVEKKILTAAVKDSVDSKVPPAAKSATVAQGTAVAQTTSLAKISAPTTVKKMSTRRAFRA